MTVGGRALTLVAAALALIAVGNFVQRANFSAPSDGAAWIDRDGEVAAARVVADGPAARAGVRLGDIAQTVNGRPVERAADIVGAIYASGPWTTVEYGLKRDGVAFNARVLLEVPTGRGAAEAFEAILGVVYLLLGGLALARRSEKPLVRRFFLFCLASFVLYVYRYSGELDVLDRFVYWSNIWATALTPALFLHFCLSFPRNRLSFSGKVLTAGAYTAAAVLIATHHGVAGGGLRGEAPLLAVRESLDRVSYALLGAGFLIGAAALLRRRSIGKETLSERRQRRWLGHATLWGAAPFCALYVAPFAAGRIPGPNHTLAVLSLALIPIGFLIAIARHRLMDVNLMVRRGAAYTLATAGVLGLFYGVVFLLRGGIESYVGGLGPALWAASVVAAALLFQPLRRLIQRVLERRYFRDRYDYRRTLTEFGTELSAEIDPNRMLDALTERLRTTLAVEPVAVFVEEADGGTPCFTPARGPASASDLDLSFLSNPVFEGRLNHLFFENPRSNRLDPTSARRAVAELGLHCYVPCVARGRVIAWIGLGATESGDYPSSEDIELVRALSGNFAIALENARLYRSLERKAAELGRLKEYNENIVESLHVGILAVGLDDRVESWNTQLELMFGISRAQAVGRKLAEVLPASLAAQCEAAPGDSSVHNIYEFTLRAAEFPAPFKPAADSADAVHERVLNIAVAPLIAKNFDSIGRLIILDDVTERAELERRVVQADKLSSIGLLAAGVAHEVNTPLAVISSYAQMLAKQTRGDETQERILEKITKQTFRASEIVNSLLSFSRTPSKEFEAVDVKGLIEETLALIEPQLRKARIRAATEFPADAPPARGVRNKLQQVFLNLFLNARDAMPEGGALRVAAEVRGGRLRVAVSDEGVGISREQARRIFDPFFTTKGGKGGTGLGLAVTYGIVKEHAGEITVESSPGRGATFLVELPVVEKPVHA